MQLSVLRRELRGIVIALLMVAVTTLFAYFLVKYLYLRRGSVLYLVPVLLASWHLGLLPAMVAGVAGLLWSGYLFYSPDYSFFYFVAQPFELINLFVFMGVATTTSHLATSMKRQTELARRREREMSDLYTFSRRLAAAPSAADIYHAIEQHLANLTGRKVVLFRTGGRPGDPGQPNSAVPDRVRTAIDEVEKGVRSESTLDDGTGNIWLIRPVSQKTSDFGVIAVDLGRLQVEAVDDMRQRIEEVLSDAAATLERLDVARAINEAKMRAETEQLREALIGSVSHELRTPLASILGAATVLWQSPVIANDERTKSLAGVVRDEAERLNNDIQNLLDATRISRDQVKPRPEWIEPADIVNTTLERRRRRLAGHNISIDMDFESAIHLCRSGSDRTGLRTNCGQRSQIFPPRFNHYRGREAQWRRIGAVGPGRGGGPYAGGKVPSRGAVLPCATACQHCVRLRPRALDRQGLRERQWRAACRGQRRRQPGNHGLAPFAASNASTRGQSR